MKYDKSNIAPDAAVLCIPEGVTQIPDEAFLDCANLTEVVFPSSLIEIGKKAFAGCSGLTELVFPEGLKTIGDLAFQNCFGLKRVFIPSTLERFGSETDTFEQAEQQMATLNYTTTTFGIYGVNPFQGCDSLAEIIVDARNPVFHTEEQCLIHTRMKYLLYGCCSGRIPESDAVEIIGAAAFHGCKHLSAIHIPANIKFVFSTAFRYCSGVQYITADNDHSVYHSTGNCLIHTSSKTLILGCCNSSIPSDGSVTSIGPNAFLACDSLTELILPEEIKSIAENAFAECKSLSMIRFPSHAVELGKLAFAACGMLKQVSVVCGSIGEAAFQECTALTDVTISGALKTISHNCFWKCTALQTVVIPPAVEVLEEAAFGNCKALRKIVLPTALKTIGRGAFYNCNMLSMPVFPESLRKIEAFAFQNCFSVYHSLVFPANLAAIGEGAFLNCFQLKEIHFALCSIEIGNRAFENCKALSVVEGLSQQAAIGADAFKNCPYDPAAARSAQTVFATTFTEAAAVDQRTPSPEEKPFAQTTQTDFRPEGLAESLQQAKAAIDELFVQYQPEAQHGDASAADGSFGPDWTTRLVLCAAFIIVGIVFAVIGRYAISLLCVAASLAAFAAAVFSVFPSLFVDLFEHKLKVVHDAQKMVDSVNVFVRNVIEGAVGFFKNAKNKHSGKAAPEMQNIPVKETPERICGRIIEENRSVLELIPIDLRYPIAVSFLAEYAESHKEAAMEQGIEAYKEYIAANHIAELPDYKYQQYLCKQIKHLYFTFD